VRTPLFDLSKRKTGNGQLNVMRFGTNVALVLASVAIMCVLQIMVHSTGSQQLCIGCILFVRVELLTLTFVNLVYAAAGTGVNAGLYSHDALKRDHCSV